MSMADAGKKGTLLLVVLLLFSGMTGAAMEEKLEHINASPLKEKGAYHVCPVFKSIENVTILKRGGPYGKEHTRELKSGEFSFDAATGKLTVKAPVDNEKEVVLVRGKRSSPAAWFFEKGLDPKDVYIVVNDCELEEGEGYTLDAKTGKLTILDPAFGKRGARYYIRAGGHTIGNCMPTEPEQDDGKKTWQGKGGGCSISGRVLDGKGEPLDGVAVAIDCSEHGFSATVLTDRRGKYSVESLKPGYYSVALSGKGVFGTLKEHRSTNLEPGEESTIDFIPRADAAALSGVVLDPEGDPVARCYLSIHNAGHSFKEGVDYVHKTAWTDAEGFFLFENLPAGSFDITLSKQEVLCLSPGGTVRLEAGVETETTIRIHPGIVRGTVAFVGAGPPDGEQSQLVATRRGDFGGSRWSASAEYNGSFAIQNLPAGKYEVKASAKGFYCVPHHFEIRKGKKPGDIVVRLRAAGSVLFKVTNRKGEPVEGLSISRIVPGKGSSSVRMEKLSAGEFRVFSIEPGSIPFRLSASGVGNVEKKVSVKAGKETVVTVKI